MEHESGAVPVAYVVLNENANEAITFEQLQNLCDMELQEIYRPAEFVALESLPLTANGKVDYRALELHKE